MNSPAMLVAVVAFCAVNSFSQTPGRAEVNLPKPDADGWIKLFRGDNPQDWFTMYGGGATKNYPDDVFKAKGDTLQVAGNPAGHVLFKQVFSHYRVSYQLHFPNNKFGNCGMLLHVQEKDPLLFNLFPRSVECQGDPNQGIGQLWCISNVWVDVKAKMDGNKPRYDSTAAVMTWGAANGGDRVITGKDGWGGPKLTNELNQAWTTVEAEVNGSDSIKHFVNGIKVIRYDNIRVGPANDSKKVEKLLKDGLIAWQSEGVPVWYRNIKIKLLPKDPLYAKLYPVSVAKAKPEHQIVPLRGKSNLSQSAALPQSQWILGRKNNQRNLKAIPLQKPIQESEIQKSRIQ